MRAGAASEPTRVIPVIGSRPAHVSSRLFLEGLTGPARGRVFRLRPGLTRLGRDDDCEIRLLDDDVSRRHAEILVEGDQRALLKDLGSTNGTTLNGRDLGRDVRAIADGDEIGVGASLLRVRRV